MCKKRVNSSGDKIQIRKYVNKYVNIRGDKNPD